MKTESKKYFNIISNDITLKITSYHNAKYVLTHIIEYNNYNSRKESIYGLFGSIIYRSISRQHRERFFYEYFKKKNLEQNIENFKNLDEYKNYYNSLQEYSDEKNIVKDFYYLIYDLYDRKKIFIKMKFSEIYDLIRDTDDFKRISRSKYNPSDVFYYFMDKLEQKLLNKNVNEISDVDRYVLAKYYENLEDSKEDGEI